VGSREYNKPQKSFQKVRIVNAGNQFQSKPLSPNLFYIRALFLFLLSLKK
jgi:hypothetical protein